MDGARQQAGVTRSYKGLCRPASYSITSRRGLLRTRRVNACSVETHCNSLWSMRYPEITMPRPLPQSWVILGNGSLDLKEISFESRLIIITLIPDVEGRHCVVKTKYISFLSTWYTHYLPWREHIHMYDQLWQLLPFHYTRGLINDLPVGALWCVSIPIVNFVTSFKSMHMIPKQRIWARASLGECPTWPVI